jgi:hypothetical protein
MMKGLKLAAVSAVFLIPFTYPSSAISLNALTYQQAVSMCQMGDPRACAVANAYRSGSWGGSPADQWVSPEELQHGGLRGVRPGPLSTYDFIR